MLKNATKGIIIILLCFFAQNSYAYSIIPYSSTHTRAIAGTDYTTPGDNSCKYEMYIANQYGQAISSITSYSGFTCTNNEIDISNVGYYTPYQALNTLPNYFLIKIYHNGGSNELLAQGTYYKTTTAITNPIVDTQIIAITPTNNQIIATSSIQNGIEGATTTITVEYYINANDIGTFTGLDVVIDQVDQNYLYGFSSLSPYSFTENFTGEAGHYEYTRDIWLPVGGYAIHARLNNTYLGLESIFSEYWNRGAESQDNSNPIAQYHYYKIGKGTYFSEIRQGAGNTLENVLSATSTASSTPTIADCNILYGFDFGKCMALTFIPKTEDIKNFGTKISTGLLSKFPLGYAWNFYQILQGTSTTAITPINAKVPSALGLGSSTIYLTIDSNTLDYLWNATTSNFSGDNPTTDNTQTFYSIISFYWNIIVYIAVGMYLMARIIGTHLIPDWWNSEKAELKRLRRK